VAEMKSVLPGLPGNQPARGARERTDVHDPWQKTPGPLLAILSDQPPTCAGQDQLQGWP
jgi:hypothetical protein